MISLWFLLILPAAYIAGWLIWYFRYGGLPSPDIPNIVSFHKITDIPELGGTFNTQRQFRNFMDYIYCNDYTTPCLSSILDKPGSGIALFFDDAYENIYENAYGIMKSRNIKGVLCPVVDYIGRMNSWDRGINRYAHMNWEQIMELSSNGFDIISHSMSHRDLRKLNDSELAYELIHSKSVLEKKLGRKIEYFIYPYGLYDMRVKRAVKAAGYKAAFTSHASHNRKFDRYAIGRNSMYIIDSVHTLGIYLKRKNVFLYGHEEAKGRIINWFARFSAYMEI